MSPAARFVIFAAPRTGSNLLCSLLNGHPDILCHHGLFNPGGIHGARDREVALGTTAERDRDTAAFLDRVWAASGGARTVGFKLNLGESRAATELLIADRSVCKLLLRRRNRVRTYVSEAIADRTGVWESYELPAEAPLPAVRVAPAELLRHAERNAAWYAEIEAALALDGQDWLDTDYEALDDPTEIARILALLGVGGAASLVPACRKRGPAELGAVVANLDELAGALAGTPLAADLAAPEAPELRSLTLTP